MSSRSPVKEHPQQPDAIQKRISAAKEAKIVTKSGFGLGLDRVAIFSEWFNLSFRYSIPKKDRSVVYHY